MIDRFNIDTRLVSAAAVHRDLRVYEVQRKTNNGELR